jgi:hypothetical protein
VQIAANIKSDPFVFPRATPLCFPEFPDGVRPQLGVLDDDPISDLPTEPQQINDHADCLLKSAVDPFSLPDYLPRKSTLSSNTYRKFDQRPKFIRKFLGFRATTTDRCAK